MEQNSRRHMLKSAVGMGGLAVTASVLSTGEASATTGSGVGWINVMDLTGVLGNDVNNDQPAIQTAIDAAGQGSTFYFPPGKYRFSGTLTLKEGVTLRADWAPHFVPRTDMVDSYIRPSAGGLFTDTALISITPAPSLPAETYKDTALGGGPRLYGLSLQGHTRSVDASGSVSYQQILNASGAPIDGVSIGPGTRDVGMDKVTIWGFSGNGLNAVGAGCVQFNQVVSSTNGLHGFSWTKDPNSTTNSSGLQDADLFQCYAQSNGQNGFNIMNPNAVTMAECRSEWNSQYGYYVGGRCDSMVLLGCFTDRSGLDGFHVSLDSGRAIQLVGCLAKRDGSAGSSSSPYSGFYIGSNGGPGAVLTSCSTIVTAGDPGNVGIVSPAYGLTAAQLAPEAVVQVVGGQFGGTTAAFHDLGAALVRHSGVISAVYDATTGAPLFDESDVHMISGAAQSKRELQFWTRGAAPRWALRANAAAETGGHAGSDFELGRYDDTGVYLDAPITVTRATGVVTLKQVTVQGDVVVSGAGRGLRVKEGDPNAKMGVHSLAGATGVAIPTTAVTANSRIFLTVQQAAGTASGVAYVSSRVPGTSFTIKGTTGDTSDVAWMIVEPS
jgi:hypothetical protein